MSSGGTSGDEARREQAEAREVLEEQESHWPRISRLVALLRREQEDNHFGARIEQAFRSHE